MSNQAVIQLVNEVKIQYSLLVQENNRKEAIEERHHVLDTAYPIDEKILFERLSSSKTFLMLEMSNSLNTKIEALLQDPDIQENDDCLIGLKNLLEKTQHEAKCYNDISAEIADYLEKFRKLDMSAIEREAQDLVLQFTKNITSDNHPYKTTWPIIQDNLEFLSDQYSMNSEKYKDTILSRVLNPNENEFIDLFESSTKNIYNLSALIMEGELVYLAFARLCWMGLQPTTASLGKVMGLMTKMTGDFAKGTGYFKNDDYALKLEVMKLLIHRAIKPDEKNLWIGTGTDITAWSKKYPGTGVYLNTSDSAYSWSLNRTYMEIAGYLDFKLVFIQRQFPGVKSAVLLGDTLRVLIELLRECRSDEEAGSMYNHESRPTWTSLEILSLTEMGFTAHEDNQGFLQMQLKNPIEIRQNPEVNMSSGLSLGAAVLLRGLRRRPFKVPRSHSAEPAISLQREDRTSNEILRIFEIPHTEGEKTLAARVEQDRIKTRFEPSENNDNAMHNERARLII